MNSTFHRYLQGILRRLGKAGVSITPCFFVREALDSVALEIAFRDIRIEPEFTFCALTEDDLPEINRLRPNMGIHRYRDYMRAGMLCFGLKDGEHLAAKMWINFRSINSELYSRPLTEREAYLFDAYSDENYRGKNLAPHLRLKCYAEAQARGRGEIYSITDFTNTSARKFKAKLGAINEALIVSWQLFGFKRHNWVAWRFNR